MPRKLLLADDSITIQKVVGITLANEDLEIVSVDNGEDAIARAKALKPDMVLADASMPKKDGYQVAEALKGDPETAAIPVVILAGQLEGHPDQARLTASRADGFLPKPFESQMLIDRVRSTLGLSAPVAAARPPATPPPPARPMPGAPLSAPRPPAPASAPMAATVPATPAAAASMVAAPAAATAATMKSPAAAAPAAMAAAAPAIDETDFGDLSAQPAASGDQDLWGNDMPVSGGGIPDESLWTQSETAEPTPNPGDNSFVHPDVGTPVPPAHGDEPQFVTNAAELANIEKFQSADMSPSGLDLDDSALPPPRANDAAPAAGHDGANGMDASAVLAQLPPEKLEAIVREVVQKMLGPILEKIAWEVVPDLAEDIIRDELKRLTGQEPGKTGNA